MRRPEYTVPSNTTSFQSSHPKWVRLKCLKKVNISANFNPHTPNGVRRDKPGACIYNRAISILAPQTRCDRTLQQQNPPDPHFNPHTPNGVRQCKTSPHIDKRISILTPQMGCDQSSFLTDTLTSYFNLHTPSGGATQTTR